MRLAERAAGLLAAGLLLAASARAQAPPPGPDEVSDLRVTKTATTVRLSWTPPADPPDAYNVRRCLLASLRVLPSTYYGNCVAQGLGSTVFEEVTPPGDVFYIPTAQYGTTEGSLGKSWNGSLWRERIARSCSLPESPTVLTLSVSILDDVEFCGTEVTVTYPPDLLAYVDGSAACAGLLATQTTGETNATIPGEVRHNCARGTGVRGPGIVTEMQFQRGDCPIPSTATQLVHCKAADCSGNDIPVTCRLR